jgi:manganese transport protein
MDGFLRRRIPLAVRRLVTMVPAFALIAVGADPMRLLIVSQVGAIRWLALCAHPTGRADQPPRDYGRAVNRRMTIVAAAVITAAVVGLNGVLLWLAVTG